MIKLSATPTFDDVIALDPAATMLAVLERQRAVPYDLIGMTAKHIVGGFAEMVTITATGMERKRLRTWPDRVGQKITP